MQQLRFILRNGFTLQIYFLVTGHSVIGAKIPKKPHRLMT